MKLISFVIGTHNEGHQILEAVRSITQSGLSCNYEIILVDDESTDSDSLRALDILSHEGHGVYTKKFLGNFADHKNFMNGLCDGYWIINLDADERIFSNISYLPDILHQNEGLELLYVPRANIVYNITSEHLTRWNWKILKLDGVPLTSKFRNELDVKYVDLLRMLNCVERETEDVVYFTPPVIQFPDLQGRIYRNAPHIHWHRKVHEEIIGAKKISILPSEYDWCIQHDKDIVRQEKQNEFYSSLT